jgi:hypothetical protein
MTFLQILQDCYRRLNYTTGPATEVVTRIKAEINETHEEILSHPALHSMLYSSMVFNSVASTIRYGISNIAQIRTMTDPTNQFALQPRTLDWFRARNPAAQSGTPEYYIPVGTVATQIGPSAPSTGKGLWVSSTSGADTAVTVNIDAIRLGGYPHSVAATTLTGTTRAAIGGGSALTDYIDVTQFALSTAAAGDVTLFDAASAGTTMAVIPRGKTTSQYWGFLLCLTPTTAITYVLDVEQELFPLVADTDEPLLPPRFHRLLAIGARMKEYEKTRENDRYMIAKAQFDQGMRDLLYTVSCPPGFTIVPGGGRDQIGSNLGPYFPQGRW